MTRVTTRTLARLFSRGVLAHVLIGCVLAFHATPMAAVQTAGKTQAKPAVAGRVFQITVDRAAFEDAPSGIKTGDTIEFVNKDVFDHTSTSRTGLWDVTIPAGKKARVVMKKPGTLEYYCKLHPNMGGTIVVR